MSIDRLERGVRRIHGGLLTFSLETAILVRRRRRRGDRRRRGSTALTGTLTGPNPISKGSNPHVLNLLPGRRYTIELQSGNGATRRLPDNRIVAMPGFFDSVVVVQDDRGMVLGSNDDINWPQNCNSRVSIVAPASGTVRVLVSSFNNGESGPYAIQVRPD